MDTFADPQVNLNEKKPSIKFQQKTSVNKRIIIGVVIVAVLVVVIGVAIGVPLSRRDTSDANMNLALKVLRETPLIDGHNDLPWQMRQFTRNQVHKVNLRENTTMQWLHIKKEDMSEPKYPRIYPQTDIPRLKKGMVGAQFWAIFVDCGSQDKDAIRQALDTTAATHTWINQYDDAFKLVTTSDGILEAFKANRIASLIGLEGGHMLGNTMGVLRTFYLLGCRYMTITHSCDTPWADSWKSDLKPSEYNSTNNITGLNEWGKKVIKEMNRLGMIVDLSHVSKQTMIDSIEASSAPVIFSHSSAFGYCNHYRNVQDDVLQMVKKNKGLVMVNFYNGYINCPPNKKENATLSQVAEHFDYIKNKIGVDYVGVGADYDGVPQMPVGLEDASTYPDLFAELARRGYKEEELKKIAGENFLRVFKDVENERDRLKGNPPFEDLYPVESLNLPCNTNF